MSKYLVIYLNQYEIAYNNKFIVTSIINKLKANISILRTLFVNNITPNQTT